MKQLRILIVEEDPISQKELEMMLTKNGHRIAAVLDNARNVTSYLEKNAVDLVLLNTSLKGPTNGIELALQIYRSRIPLIFLSTSSDELIYLQAKKTGYAGYLVKPFDRLTLQSMIELAIVGSNQMLASSRLLLLWQDKLANKEIVFIRNVDQLVKLDLTDLLVVEADGNYCLLHTLDRKFIIKSSLRKLKLRLTLGRFHQIHRKFIIQLSHVDRVDLSTGEVLIQDLRIPIGNAYRREFMMRLDGKRFL